jgi:hypothetical protein
LTTLFKGCSLIKGEASVKKLLFVLTVFAFLSASCSEVSYPVTVENHSDEKTVWYDYDGFSYILGPNETKAYEVGTYTKPPENITIPGQVYLSVKMTSMRGELFTFEDVDPLELRVTNLLPVLVGLKADNYIDTGDSTTTLTIPAADSDGNGNKVVNIYTANPVFTVDPEYAVLKVDREIEDNVIYVTITIK